MPGSVPWAYALALVLHALYVMHNSVLDAGMGHITVGVHWFHAALLPGQAAITSTVQVTYINTGADATYCLQRKG